MKFKSYDRKGMRAEIKRLNDQIATMSRLQRAELDQLKRERDLWHKAAIDYGDLIDMAKDLAREAHRRTLLAAHRPWWKGSRRSALVAACVELESIIDAASGKYVKVHAIPADKPTEGA